jgi:hypothetical protein
MIVGLLLNGTVLAVVLIVVSFLLSRFTRDIIGRSLLAIVLIIAALMYVVFAARADEGAFWVVGELVGGRHLRHHVSARPARLAYVACGGMGVAPPLGRGASLLWAGKLVRSHKLHDSLRQFRFTGRRLHRHRLRVWTTGATQSSLPRDRSLAALAPRSWTGATANFREFTF